VFELVLRWALVRMSSAVLVQMNGVPETLGMGSRAFCFRSMGFALPLFCRCRPLMSDLTNYSGPDHPLCQPGLRQRGAAIRSQSMGSSSPLDWRTVPLDGAFTSGPGRSRWRLRCTGRLRRIPPHRAWLPTPRRRL